MKKRLISITIIGWIFVVVGCIVVEYFRTRNLRIRVEAMNNINGINRDVVQTRI